MQDITRRSFVSGAAVAGTSASLATSLAGAYANSVAAHADEPSASYKDKPQDIPDDMIAQTYEADVVVVGAGNAGASAILTAAEAGATVVCLQKAYNVFCHGDGYGCVGAKIQKEAGLELDGWEIAGDIARDGGCNTMKWEQLRNWVNYSGETVDWIIDHCNDILSFRTATPKSGFDWWNRSYPIAINMDGDKIGTGANMTICTHMVEEAEALGGVTMLYSTPAVQLRQDEDGRVAGVVGQTEDGEYVLCKAGKAVILCAGGYESNEEMRLEYMPWTVGLKTGYSVPYTTGDGILMGMWAGGKIQNLPHASNIHYDPGIAVPDFRGTSAPWLRVNILGKRFSNEDVEYDELWAQDQKQPGCMHYQVFDANFGEYIDDLGVTLMRTPDWPSMVKEGVEAGDIFTGDTIEELAEAMGVPVDNLVATVKRYNELAEACANGKYTHEPDYGKLAEKVKPIDTPPYYAIARQATVLTSFSGLEVDEYMRVLTADNEVVEGLYAAGNCAGDFFGGLAQTMRTASLPTTRAAMTARIAVKHALGITL